MDKKRVFLENAIFLLLDDHESDPETAGKILATTFHKAVDILYPARDESYRKSVNLFKRTWIERFVTAFMIKSREL
jgi:hypothetical protein